MVSCTAIKSKIPVIFVKFNQILKKTRSITVTVLNKNKINDLLIFFKGIFQLLNFCHFWFLIEGED